MLTWVVHVLARPLFTLAYTCRCPSAHFGLPNRIKQGTQPGDVRARAKATLLRKRTSALHHLNRRVKNRNCGKGPRINNEISASPTPTVFISWYSQCVRVGSEKLHANLE
jgi:hypothetical protein